MSLSIKLPPKITAKRLPLVVINRTFRGNKSSGKFAMMLSTFIAFMGGPILNPTFLSSPGDRRKSDSVKYPASTKSSDGALASVKGDEGLGFSSGSEELASLISAIVVFSVGIVTISLDSILALMGSVGVTSIESDDSNDSPVSGDISTAVGELASLSRAKNVPKKYPMTKKIIPISAYFISLLLKSKQFTGREGGEEYASQLALLLKMRRGWY
jgi:hypothetical protein|tara:strand:- start:1026 stop:1667 length:642 start_codon:yes stop_codon:yes gene_type:complete